MNYLFYFLYFPYEQFKNFWKYIRGIPLITPSLGSITLDIDDIKIARRMLKNKWIWYNDKVVHKFEKKFALWNGSNYAFAFLGGRVALSASIYALQLQKGDEVIVPGYTCVVVPNAFHFEGIKTVYSDIELDTYGLDASLIEEKITRNTKAIVLHHLYGLVCRDYEKIIEIAKQNGLFIIEDCAQATGAEYRNIKVGNFGDVAIYSTEQSKVFTTIQGGIVTTNNVEIAKRLKEYYEHTGYPSRNYVKKLLYSIIINYYNYKDTNRWWRGSLIKLFYSRFRIVSTTQEEENGIKPQNYRLKMPAALALIGLNQLKKIDFYNNKRIEGSQRWNKWCMKNKINKPLIIPYSKPIFLRYPVLVSPDKKKDTSWAIKELGVNLGVWFIGNLHPVTRPILGCPNADKAIQQCVNFPCHIEE